MVNNGIIHLFEHRRIFTGRTTAQREPIFPARFSRDFFRNRSRSIDLATEHAPHEIPLIFVNPADPVSGLVFVFLCIKALYAFIHHRPDGLTAAKRQRFKF